MNDLIYKWKEANPVQMVANLSLPGGFKMDSFDNKNCDVKTATGKILFTMTLVMALGQLTLGIYAKVTNTEVRCLTIWQIL